MKSGGLGIRSAVHLAPSAYLASFAGCRELTFTILPPRFQKLPLSLWDAEWSTCHNKPPPSGPTCMSHRQKSWDLPRVSTIAAELLARLLSASKKESGSWLHTLPVTSLGLRMDDNTIRIAIGLRLGTPLCIPVKDQSSRSLRAAPSSQLLDFHHRTRPRNTCTVHIIHSIKVRINVILDLEAPAIHPLSG